MACTCVEEFKNSVDNTGNPCVVGINRIVCAECTSRINAERAFKIKTDEISEKQKYLKDTDYIITRQYEQNTLSVEDFNSIKVLRQAARDRINVLQS